MQFWINRRFKIWKCIAKLLFETSMTTLLLLNRVIALYFWKCNLFASPVFELILISCVLFPTNDRMISMFLHTLIWNQICVLQCIMEVSVYLWISKYIRYLLFIEYFFGNIWFENNYGALFRFFLDYRRYVLFCCSF